MSRSLTGVGEVAWFVTLIALVLTSMAVGSANIAIIEVIDAILRAVGLSDPHVAKPLDRIIIELRLPRTIVAVMVGAGLGVVGCLLQTVTRNDLADPFLFGLSSGAARSAASSRLYTA